MAGDDHVSPRKLPKFHRTAPVLPLSARNAQSMLLINTVPSAPIAGVEYSMKNELCSHLTVPVAPSSANTPTLKPQKIVPSAPTAGVA